MKNKKPSLLELKLHLVKILKESGDLENIDAYSYKNNEFETEEGWKVKVEFDNLSKDHIDYFNIPKNTKNVAYSIEGSDSQYKKTTYRKLIKILKTVSDIIIDYVNKNKKIDGLTFFAAHKNADKSLLQTDSQKTAIYKAIVLNRISKLGLNWTIRNLEVDSDYKGFILYKNK